VLVRWYDTSQALSVWRVCYARKKLFALVQPAKRVFFAVVGWKRELMIVRDSRADGSGGMWGSGGGVCMGMEGIAVDGGA
jgi:hypothetical protein